MRNIISCLVAIATAVKLDADFTDFDTKFLMPQETTTTQTYTTIPASSSDLYLMPQSGDIQQTTTRTCICDGQQPATSVFADQALSSQVYVMDTQTQPATSSVVVIGDAFTPKEAVGAMISDAVGNLPFSPCELSPGSTKGVIGQTEGANSQSAASEELDEDDIKQLRDHQMAHKKQSNYSTQDQTSMIRKKVMQIEGEYVATKQHKRSEHVQEQSKGVAQQATRTCVHEKTVSEQAPSSNICPCN